MKKPALGQPSTSDAGRSVRRDDLADRLAAFARDLQREQDPSTSLAKIVTAAVDLVPGCEAASISVVLGRRLVNSDAATGPLPRLVDALQEDLGEGPCLDAAYEHMTVRVSDMATEQRWPRFAPLAREVGAASMLSCQLYVDGDDLGALNLFARSAWAFDDESEHVALLYSAHAAVGYAAAQSKDRAGRTMATRQLIGQAQGILMERRKLTAEGAFTLLVTASQAQNRPLRVVAEELVRSGELKGVA